MNGALGYAQTRGKCQNDFVKCSVIIIRTLSSSLHTRTAHVLVLCVGHNVHIRFSFVLVLVHHYTNTSGLLFSSIRLIWACVGTFQLRTGENPLQNIKSHYFAHARRNIIFQEWKRNTHTHTDSERRCEWYTSSTSNETAAGADVHRSCRPISMYPHAPYNHFVDDVLYRRPRSLSFALTLAHEDMIRQDTHDWREKKRRRKKMNETK